MVRRDQEGALGNANIQRLERAGAASVEAEKSDQRGRRKAMRRGDREGVT